MRTLLLIPLAALLLGAAPLTESQQTRLETADDGSATIDESALYALLENAAEWEPGEAGATIPNYDDMLENPAAWRGRLCLIEGVLLTELPPPNLARSGWEHVRGLVIQVSGFDMPRREIGPENMVIVYLTDPPELHPARLQLDENLLAESGADIRLVARFFKVVNEKNRRGEDRLYLTFVGRDVAKLERAAGGANFVLPLVLALMVVMGGYILIRMLRRGKGMFAQPHQMAEYLTRKRAERDALEADAIEPEQDPDEEDIDLPENPADALDTLASRRRDVDTDQ